MQEIIRVNMTGEEYIKYKESRRLKIGNLSENQKLGLIIIIVSLLAILLIPLIHEGLNPKPGYKLEYTQIASYPVPNIVLMWFALAIGLGWIFHGVGFFIVRG